MKTLTFAFCAALTVASPLALFGAFGCSSSSPSEILTDAAAHPDTGSSPGVDGGDGGPSGPTCYTNPKTHVEIINACTDAQAVDKTVNLPLLNPDGSLPPIP